MYLISNMHLIYFRSVLIDRQTKWTEDSKFSSKINLYLKQVKRRNISPIEQTYRPSELYSRCSLVERMYRNMISLKIVLEIITNSSGRIKLDSIVISYLTLGLNENELHADIWNCRVASLPIRIIIWKKWSKTL